MKKMIHGFLKIFGYSIVKLENPKPNIHFAALWNKISDDQKATISPYLVFSKSQYAQDLFVINELSDKKNGYFVEFGATDGIRWSNSWVLEKKLGWTGILSEPARTWHNALSKNRDCSIDHRCVTDTTGQLVEFLETGNPTEKFEVSSPELSSMAKYANSGDWASKIRVNNSVKYNVETVSLNDLLKFHNAPSHINYLSIDTEGSEVLILRGLDFKSYSFDTITVEHNRDSVVRKTIHDILTSNGYLRKHEDISGADDWYVLNVAI